MHSSVLMFEVWCLFISDSSSPLCFPECILVRPSVPEEKHIALTAKAHQLSRLDRKTVEIIWKLIEMQHV